ncbi:hypothetical protein GWI33_001865 [Rhynchophorus ferrugineus]|uniref:Uncharacterized protein n=1 Tax=Rhynchophorus ferrugineus TaxID=354439 RepID=A0A834MLL5_RHYFE|nr:hypothetical protein GWI33_001865 [Rhynchophorus ferrugineus]
MFGRLVSRREKKISSFFRIYFPSECPGSSRANIIQFHLVAPIPIPVPYPIAPHSKQKKKSAHSLAQQPINHEQDKQGRGPDVRANIDGFNEKRSFY